MPVSFYKSRASRQESLLLPARIDDDVGADNAVRAIDGYVGTLDLGKRGFVHAARVVGAGQPPYDPADLLKLYLYGYLNQIRSSRRLEREAGRNIELMWLLGGLVPGYRTIARFRAENAVALRQVNRDFVLILRQLGLVGGETRLSRTDPDARLLAKTGQSVSGYNVQIAVDAAHNWYEGSRRCAASSD
jgi:transposase